MSFSRGRCGIRKRMGGVRLIHGGAARRENRKYQFMEQNLQRRVVGLKDKLPDIRKTLDTVRFLKLRTVWRPTKSTPRKRMALTRPFGCDSPSQTRLRPRLSSTTRSTQRPRYPLLTRCICGLGYVLSPSIRRIYAGSEQEC